jgi:hypothetical protein
LSCDAKGQCVAEADCQEGARPCVVRRAYYDEDVYDHLDNYSHTGIVALAATESHVYWLEYGTRDSLGHYQHDGALMSSTGADGTIATVAIGLDGPSGLGVTTTHAYVGTVGTDTPPGTQLSRVPLSGGSPQPLTAAKYPYTSFNFAATGDRAFWDMGEGIYSMSSNSDAVPTLFLEASGVMAVDTTDLYYLSSDGLMMRTPIASAAPMELGAWSHFAVALHDDGIYSFFYLKSEAVTPPVYGAFLARAAKSDGIFERVRPLGAGYPNTLQVVGDRYFFDLNYYDEQAASSRKRVLTASFVDDAPPTQLVDFPQPLTEPELLWVGTGEALYFSDGHTLRRQPLPTP